MHAFTCLSPPLPQGQPLCWVLVSCSPALLDNNKDLQGWSHLQASLGWSVHGEGEAAVSLIRNIISFLLRVSTGQLLQRAALAPRPARCIAQVRIHELLCLDLAWQHLPPGLPLPLAAPPAPCLLRLIWTSCRRKEHSQGGSGVLSEGCPV